jgi:hypothetical protein
METTNALDELRTKAAAMVAGRQAGVYHDAILTPGLVDTKPGRGVILSFDGQGARLVTCASDGDGYGLDTTAMMGEARLTWGDLADLASNGTERLHWGKVTLTPDELARLVEVVNVEL